ncbi:MAG: tryptophan--tRNA ligase [Alphaproteobacteria bacterium]
MNKTLLTGVKPTGNPHIGNLFGAILPMINLINQNDGQSFVFIANIHALNGVKDAQFLREKTYEIAATFLTFGLDPQKTIFYRQSDISEIFEITSLIMNFTPKGLMNRAHAYKAILERDGNDDNVNMGLYTYPILMAADILAMNSDIVPVGLDQKQHIEIARDIANSFNSVYKKDVLKLPEEFIQYQDSILGLDGRKMSKSYGNTIELFATEEDTRKKIMKIPTDSLLPADKKTDDSTLYKLMKMFKVDDEYLKQYLAGGIGYGDAKKKLAEIVNNYLLPYREKYNTLISDKAKIDEILSEGAVKARNVASGTLHNMKKTLGL